MERSKHISDVVQVYAQDEKGKSIHINQIDESHNGLACNCTCPICGEKLIARKGHGGKTPHFAHQQCSPCTHPEYIKQSTIHAMAEQIFLEEKEINLPSLSKQAGNYIAHFFNGVKWQIEEVELEKKISDFIPDIILKNGNKILLVEIYVTHAVDEDKRKKIFEANLPVIEIDLSEFVHDNMAKDDLRLHLREPSRMKWIHLPDVVPIMKNFINSKNTFSVDKPHLEIKDCPRIRHGKKVTKETCMRCPFCVGLSDDYVECFYHFRLSGDWGKYPYPVLQPDRQEFDQVLIPMPCSANIPSIVMLAMPRIGTAFFQKEPSYHKKTYSKRYNSRRGRSKW